MSLRRIVVASAALTLAAGLAACSSSEGDDTTLRISASSTPHVEILDQIVSTGALGDYKLDIVEITGEVDPNELLEAGDVDANFFQHEPYLTDWQKQKGVDDLVAVADVHLEPIGLYSNKIASLDDLKDGDTVAVPRDTTNYARALYLLESAGLLEMDVPFEEADLSVVTESNITANPKNLNLVAIERPQLARQLDDAQITAAVINSNYALEAGLNPAEDAIVTEEVENNPFSNLLVVRAENENDPAVTALAEALESPETAAWIEETYSGAVLPVHPTN
ncbi:ABC transporter substrate-binding protein [Rhodococcus rhodochrous]|uniref:MetQ/NlpA family ABC transporter substrate-binding protein n=1 Tax=Rhodococcus TaxID=1827 RepID=UPI000750DCD1|nr:MULTISPECIES: MetQ/NlpA family ABC transporter substrate-binding protein [Rhodococcus]MDC3727936.1 ABC transporter substrate-binding protein [Rhodococcus sp. Rp3]MDJ0398314.1 MetQ/NlpA family ABC transporter substrate-binding protein [Rhodococcus rhodochrous]MDO1482421.1 ABC transporter substrate-binding protein [Rhodococcus rhodochrous]WSE20821.1 MetQ/NlpA family ABC transporter substrate-binding protein [Rhodococcus sp. PD04]SNV20724.1 ABC transporter substrate-binding protein [Rhodococcu